MPVASAVSVTVNFLFKTNLFFEKREKKRSAVVLREMNINYRYEFIIPGQQPYELKEMKMVTFAAETENSTGYICEMIAFTLNGIKFTDQGNPVLLKRPIQEK